MIALSITPVPTPAPNGISWRGARRREASTEALFLTLCGAPWPAPAPRLLYWEGDAISGRGPPGLAPALLCNFLDIAPEAEGEFNDWYDSEHVPALCAASGVIRAWRYRAAQHAPRYLALFALEAADIAQSPAWRQAADTPWTARMKRFTSGYQSFLFRPMGV